MITAIGVLLVAAVATAGDFIWYTYGVQHTVLAGVVHGALLLTAVGAVLGAANGRLLKGLPVGTLAGIGGAAIYYALVAATGGQRYGASIPAAWITMWLLLAALEGRWLRAPRRRTWAEIARRGAVAAIAGGVAFFLVMNLLWGRPPAGGRNYALQWLAWTFAWAPGLFALTAGRSAARSALATAPSAAAVQDEAQDEAPGGAAEGSITVRALRERIARGDALCVLDVRSEGEFARGHVPGAVNIPFNQVPFQLDAVPGSVDDELIVYCGHGPRAYVAATFLRSGGRHRIVYLSGHWAAWQSAGVMGERD